MVLPQASYLIVPAHLVVGSAFALIPSSVYHPAYQATYGAIALLLIVTLIVYGSLLRRRRPALGTLWLQALLSLLAVAIPFFLVDFSDPWHAIVYLPIMGGSVLACLIVGHALRLRR